VNITTKKNQIHRYKEQTSGYQWGEGRGRGLRVTHHYIGIRYSDSQFLKIILHL